MISSRVTSGATRWSLTAGDEPRPGRRRDPPDAPGALRLIPERFSSIVDIIPEMTASVEGPGACPPEEGAASPPPGHPRRHGGGEAVRLLEERLVSAPREDLQRRVRKLGRDAVPQHVGHHVVVASMRQA